MMKTGIELITQERQEQIEKHRRTIQEDVELNTTNQLSKAASLLCDESWICLDEDDIIEDYCPEGWSKILWSKMVRKPYKDRLKIAGALIAAELDRLNHNDL
jgi:hypothetical protein